MEMMDEERIGMVLVRASELRSKLASCIQKSTAKNPVQDQDIDGESNSNNIQNQGAIDPSSNEADDDDEEAEALLDICSTFDSLESQLASLQALQQQQQYEREAAIAEIEFSRKMLLKKLSEYNGEHMDVVQEAEAFASMKVEYNNELLLPPYPTRSPSSLVLNNSSFSRYSTIRKLTQNGYNGSDLKNESQRSQAQSGSNKLWGGLKFLVHSTAKTMLTLVGVISFLSIAGFEPRLSKKGSKLNVSTLFSQHDADENRLPAQCPPGKVAVIEGGEIRCIVKERVEIPFGSVADNPSVNYGCG